jgi:hypothetical protein
MKLSMDDVVAARMAAFLDEATEERLARRARAAANPGRVRSLFAWIRGRDGGGRPGSHTGRHRLVVAR